MRTQDEIVARIREKFGFFSFDQEVLLPHLDYDRAQEFLAAPKDPARAMTREEWGSKYPLDESAAMDDFRAYAEFAWGKAQDHRSLSAGRSVEKLSAWTWLLGRDDVLEAVEKAEWAQYGCPKLKVFCEAFGFPIPDDEATQRMIRGEPCVIGCDSGCGQ